MTIDPDIRVPDDAGEHADALARLLARIPPSWGRYLRCGQGWYPILVRLDAAISELAPDYQVQQVKEKFGTLRFYWEFAELRAACCIERDASDPRPIDEPVHGPGVPASRTAEQQALLDDWMIRWERHHASKQCEAGWAALEPEMERREALRGQIDALVDAAEQESARTCEKCGAAGTLNTDRYWVKTLCRPCAQRRT